MLQYPQIGNNVKVDRNTTVIFDWNTGNSFIDPANSYLKFKLKATSTTGAAAPPTFGTYGSALNIFKEIRIRSKSGTELNRTENANLMNNYLLQYGKTTNYINTIGGSYYLNSTESPFNTANTLISEICIPLRDLDSFFRPIKGVLIPPQIASGLHIEFAIESVARIFKDPAGYFGVNSVLELQDISLSLDTVNLTDETAKIVNAESSMSGLEYSYTRYHNVNSIYAAGTSSINLQISKAVSQATQIFTILQNNTNSNLSTVDSLISDSFKVQSWNYRLGSTYYPHQSVIENLNSTYNGNQSYILAMSSFEKLKMPFQESSVTLNKFSNSLSIFSVDLQRSQALQVSGLPINNSRILELNLTRDATGDLTNKLEVNAFLAYISVCKAYR